MLPVCVELRCTLHFRPHSLELGTVQAKGGFPAIATRQFMKGSTHCHEESTVSILQASAVSMPKGRLAPMANPDLQFEWHSCSFELPGCTACNQTLSWSCLRIGNVI